MERNSARSVESPGRSALVAVFLVTAMNAPSVRASEPASFETETMHFSRATSAELADVATFSNIGDFDQDGVLDLATINEVSDGISMLLGPRDAGGNGRPVVVADLDHDGALDMILTDSSQTAVGMRLGTGDGTFSQFVPLFASSGPAALAAADMNGDGHIDLVIADRTLASMALFSGRGDGTFASNGVLETGGTVASLLLADVSHDGHVDIMFSLSDRPVLVALTGHGDGTFGSRMESNLRLAASEIAAADVNGDGLPDLVVTNAGSPSVSVVLGTSDGHFRVERILRVGADPQAPLLADFDGDGRIDMAIATRGDRVIHVLHGLGNGSFNDELHISASLLPDALASLDVDRDGREDLVAMSVSESKVTILLNRIVFASSASGSELVATRACVDVESFLVACVNADAVAAIPTPGANLGLDCAVSIEQVDATTAGGTKSCEKPTFVSVPLTVKMELLGMPLLPPIAYARARFSGTGVASDGDPFAGTLRLTTEFEDLKNTPPAGYSRCDITDKMLDQWAYFHFKARLFYRAAVDPFAPPPAGVPSSSHWANTYVVLKDPNAWPHAVAVFGPWSDSAPTHDIFSRLSTGVALSLPIWRSKKREFLIWGWARAYVWTTTAAASTIMSLNTLDAQLNPKTPNKVWFKCYKNN